MDDLTEGAFTGKLEQFQTTVREVERSTELSFWQLVEHDILEGDEEAPAGGAPKVPLGSLEDVVL